MRCMSSASSCSSPAHCPFRNLVRCRPYPAICSSAPMPSNSTRARDCTGVVPADSTSNAPFAAAPSPPAYRAPLDGLSNPPPGAPPAGNSGDPLTAVPSPAGADAAVVGVLARATAAAPPSCTPVPVVAVPASARCRLRAFFAAAFALPLSWTVHASFSPRAARQHLAHRRCTQRGCSMNLHPPDGHRAGGAPFLRRGAAVVPGVLVEVNRRAIALVSSAVSASTVLGDADRPMPPQTRLASDSSAPGNRWRCAVVGGSQVADGGTTVVTPVPRAAYQNAVPML